jgi:hypothetical protein
MRKNLLLLAVLCGLSVSSFAQSSQKSGKWNIGLDVGIPLGNDVYSSVIGGAVKYEYPLAATTFLTFSAGYQRFLYDSDIKDYLNSFGIDRSGINLIPVKAGLKHYFKKGFFGEAQAGAAFSTQKGDNASFVYAAGVGYTFMSGFEVGVRYEGFSSEGDNLGTAALRVAFRF